MNIISAWNGHIGLVAIYHSCGYNFSKMPITLDRRSTGTYSFRLFLHHWASPYAPCQNSKAIAAVGNVPSNVSMCNRHAKIFLSTFYLCTILQSAMFLVLYLLFYYIRLHYKNISFIAFRQHKTHQYILVRYPILLH